MKKRPTLSLVHVAILFSLLLSSFALAGCQAGAAAVTPTPQVTPVRAANIIAEAVVVPERKATLTFTTAGTVAEVLVAEGQTVKANEPIVRLKGTERLQAAISTAELELISAQNALNLLNQNAEVARAQAQLKLAQAEKKLDKAKTDRESQQYKYGSQSQIDIARSEYLLAQEGLKQSEEKYNMYLTLPESDLTRALALTEIGKSRQLRDRALANLNYLLKKPNQYEVNVAEGDLIVAEAEVKQARADLEKLKAGPNPDEVNVLKARIKNAENQLASAKVALNDLVLVAPFDGTVISNPLSVGELASPGTSTVSVADTSHWDIETTDLTELDVVKIKEGDPVTIKFDAIPQSEFSGKIKRIRSLGQNRQGDMTYTVIINLDQQDQRLLWNMSANVSFPR